MLDGIQLYDQEGKPIDPNTKATAVFQSSILGASNVEEALNALKDSIFEITEAQGIKTVITPYFGISDSKDLNEVMNDKDISWHEKTYQFPTKEKPYTWKKQLIKTGEVVEVTYELVTVLNTNKIQNIYLATNKDEKVDIIYPKIEDPSKPEEEWEDDIQVDDTYKFKTSNDQEWVDYPRSLDNNNVYLWMATRKYENGIWTRFQPENGARIGYFYTTSDTITE